MADETAGRHVPPPSDGDVDIAVDPQELLTGAAEPDADSRPATTDPEQTAGDDLGGTAGENAGGAG